MRVRQRVCERRRAHAAPRGRRRGADAAFYKLANVYLSRWFGALTLKTFGFSPQMPVYIDNVKVTPNE